MTSNPGVGVDIGTTYSSIAITPDLSTPGELLQDKDSKHHIPSYVYYDEHGNALVGEIAVDQDPLSTIYDNKRFLGQHYKQIKDHIGNYPFKIIKDPKSDFVLYELVSNGKTHHKSPFEVATDQISHYRDIIKDRIEYNDQMGITATHPAYFDSTQKYFTYQAAKHAGFKNIHTIDEPTAAATCYVVDNKAYYDKKVREEGITDDDNGKFLSLTALVADFGGGTSDFSKIDINGILTGGEDTLRYELAGRSITGLQQFGGQDITKSIQMDFLHQIKESMGKKWDKLETEDIEDMELNLLKEAETVKHFLCNSVSHQRRFRFQRCNYNLIMTQSRLKQINQHHIESIIKEVSKCIDGDKIDQLFFVGGSSEVPFLIETVQQLVSDKCEVVRINNKRDLVARGASIIQCIRNQSDPIITLQQINSFNLGFGCFDGTMVPLISRGDSIPFNLTKSRNYKNPNTSDHCWLNIYEGNSPFTKQNTCIGSSKIEFGQVYEARTYHMKVTAELDNYGIFKTTVTPSSDTSKVIGTYTMDLGSQGKFGCDSLEKKEQYARARKQFQETRRKIDNFQDQYFCLQPILIAKGTDSNLIRKWDKWRKNISCLEEWEELISSMKAILKTYENTNDSDDDALSIIDSDSDAMSQFIDEDETQSNIDIPDHDVENSTVKSQTESDNTHNKKSVQNKITSSADDQTTSKITSVKPFLSEDDTKSQSNNNHNKNSKNKKSSQSNQPPNTNTVPHDEKTSPVSTSANDNITHQSDNNPKTNNNNKKTVRFHQPTNESVTHDEQTSVSTSANDHITDQSDNNLKTNIKNEKTVRFHLPTNESVTQRMNVDEINHDSAIDITDQPQTKRRSKRIAGIKRHHDTIKKELETGGKSSKIKSPTNKHNDNQNASSDDEADELIVEYDNDQQEKNKRKKINKKSKKNKRSRKRTKRTNDNANDPPRKKRKSS